MMTVDLHRLSGTCEELLRQLEEARASDKWAEGRKKLFLGLAIGAGVSGFLSMFIGPPLLEGLGLSPALALLMMVALGVTAIVMIVLRFKYNKYDLDDRKLDTVAQFLEIIRADTGGGDAVELSVDFRDYLKGGTCLEAGGSGKSGKYSHPWLEVAGGLVDGTRYRIAVEERIGRKERRKRKYTKIKEKISAIVSIQLRLKAQRYGDSQGVAAALQQLRPPAGLSIKSIVPRGQSLSLVLLGDTMVKVKGRYGLSVPEPGLELDGAVLLQALLWAYDGIARGASTRAA
jgi:hypothetical protein